MDLYMMKNTLKVVLLTSLLPFAASAEQELTPWYVGGGLGVNNYEPNCDQKTMKVCGEDDPYAWDVFGGYLFNDYFGVELGYRDLGRAEWTDYSNKRNDVGARGMALGLVGFYPFADKWSLSAEAGAMNYLISNKKNYNTEYYSDSGIAPYIGAGIGYNFTENLKLQAKYRRYENLDDDKYNTLDMESNYWGLELSYRFGVDKPAPAPVVAPVVAAPIDSDNDGVTDDMDKCPDTPSTHKVDAQGCTIYEDAPISSRMEGVYFDNDSAVLKPESYTRLEKGAKYLKDNPHTTAVIEGHASLVGNADYNMDLSERRAQAVVDALVEKYGIDASRLKAVGFGEDNPIMEGTSPEANKQNRRIDAVVSGAEKRPVLK
ncbi:Outer membrane porin F precursor [Shewanella sp. P1-14-1]|uniref:Outer membrane protein A n=2 Tax=Shewanellaceae TaxID=267890 RepID=A0ABN4YEV5_9GAMM|nr:Outer membrane protein A [Shewanella japonica]KPZ69007.1 Outer membrane porin F precursor [Shewanella sp. P1-14-1]